MRFDCRRVLRNSPPREHRRSKRLLHLLRLGQRGSGVEIPEGREHFGTRQREMRNGYPNRFYHNILNEIHTLKLCISATDFPHQINSENDIQAATVIPPNEQISRVIDTLNRPASTYRRRLKIVHRNQFHPTADGVFSAVLLFRVNMCIPQGKQSKRRTPQ